MNPSSKLIELRRGVHDPMSFNQFIITGNNLGLQLTSECGSVRGQSHRMEPVEFDTLRHMMPTLILLFDTQQVSRELSVACVGIGARKQDQAPRLWS